MESEKSNQLDNDKHELFCQEYLIDLNQTQAAIRAGYSPKTAQEQSSRLLSNVIIRARIGELMDARSKRLLVDGDFVIKGLLEVYHRCIQAVPVMTFDYNEKGMVQAVDENGDGVFEFDSTGANKALELIGRHLKMFTDKKEINQESKHEVELNITLNLD